MTFGDKGVSVPVALLTPRCRVSHTSTLFPLMLWDGAWYQLGWRGLTAGPAACVGIDAPSVRLTEPVLRAAFGGARVRRGGARRRGQRSSTGRKRRESPKEARGGSIIRLLRPRTKAPLHGIRVPTLIVGQKLQLALLSTGIFPSSSHIRSGGVSSLASRVIGVTGG